VRQSFKITWKKVLGILSAGAGLFIFIKTLPPSVWLMVLAAILFSTGWLLFTKQ